MFSKGDPIIHPNYGAGQIINIQTLKIGGMEKQYYQIDLVNSDERLMIPVDQAADVELRAPGCKPDDILSILAEKPEELDQNYRIRQAFIQKKVYSGDPRQMAEALRDLTYRAAQTTLAKVDLELRERARQMLVSIMAVQNGYNVQQAADRMLAVLNDGWQADG